MRFFTTPTADIRRHGRRGALLLIVLSLLVLFLLIGTAFIVTANNYQRSARVFSRHETHGNDPLQDLDGAMHLLLRGSSNPSSPLYDHSLLEDLYGNDSVGGVVRSVTPDALTGLLTLGVDLNGPPSELPFFASGNVLTMLDGPARATSQRIIGESAGEFVVAPFGDERKIPRTGDRFLLNGRPFNGTGAGFDPSTGRLDATVSLRWGASRQAAPLALLPHIALHSEEQTVGVPLHVGGADETWDAPDYQNIFLAAPSEGIPSFHRPALIEYWRTKDPDLWKDPRFRRLIVLRPLPGDHPSFTGGNPALRAGQPVGDHLVNGPWDVDNDNDGTPDSVWIDLGWPVQSTHDGRLYKPLFALLCVDLDGRININAHGNSRHLMPVSKLPPNVELAGNPTTELSKLPSGRGYGPADVMLSPLFGDEAVSLLRGNGQATGRYGSDREPGAGRRDGTLSAIELLTTQPRPHASVFADSTDVFGTTRVALDATGRPFTFTAPLPDREVSVVDDPYEVDVMAGADHLDSLFSLGEMERVLRMHDLDSRSLPNRLFRLAGNTVTDSGDDRAGRNAHLITTHSAFIPAPFDVVSNARSGRGPQRLVDLLVARLKASGMDKTEWAEQIRTILPPEILHGQRMNLNRPFGNGTDDNGNRVVDEPEESELNELAWGSSRRDLPDSFQRATFEHANDDPVIDARRFARQIQARHLYSLAMLLTDDGRRSNSFDHERTAQRLAQWAVNYVDFRDADATMTPFEYDVDPLDGWLAMDGDPATREGGQRRLVWGCEYPELIVSETVAWHDRRLRDTEDDDGAKAKRWQLGSGENQEEDPDLDQYRIPQGSLFIELYCTRSPRLAQTHENCPAELYSEDHQLELARLAPASDDQHRYPVWRLAISRQSAEQKASREPGASLEPRDADIERLVWFTSDPASDVPHDEKIFFNRSSVKTVQAGDFVVVGSRERPDLDRRRTILAAARPPTSWARSELTAPSGVGLSLSEPLPQENYYREPTEVSPNGVMDRYAHPLPDEPFDNLADRPLAHDGLPAFGTVLNHRSVYLQRLASPTDPFHARRNPYLTVDWAAIDLTIYNSQDKQPEGFPPELDPFDRPNEDAERRTLRFGSRERGRGDCNVWNPIMPQPMESEDQDPLRFAGRPRHTLGRLNSLMSRPEGDSPDTPATPFPWLAWQNEPLVSPYELMLVPISSPSHLLYEFNLGSHFGPVGHLPDFADQANDRLGKLYRLLDFVEVPSRFVGARHWFDPDVARQSPLLPFRRPPWNWCSTFREPGRININTINDPLVWRSIAKGFPPHDSEAFYEKIVRSRQGRAGRPASEFPTRYANPFRAAGSAKLMPLPQLMRRGVEATMLRSDPDNVKHRLFTANPATHPEVLEPHRNQNRNAYFYYQGLQRIGNLLSTQSNVFAVWITVGYFQVEHQDAVNGQPAELRLAAELNADTGRIRRHRAFYVIDRSIPVGFERGSDHNVLEAVLLRRLVE